MCFSHRSRNCRTVSFDGSRSLPPLISEISLAHSICACRLVPLKLCHLRLRLPVEGSRWSRMMAPSPYALREPATRRRPWWLSVKFDRPFRDTRRKQHWRSSNDDNETTGRPNRIRGLTLPVTAKELSNRGKYR